MVETMIVIILAPFTVCSAAITLALGVGVVKGLVQSVKNLRK